MQLALLIYFYEFSEKMELYLKSENQSVEFRENLEKVELVTELEFGGSSQFKDIHILVRNLNCFMYVFYQEFSSFSAPGL